jgi:hypothetical protein
MEGLTIAEIALALGLLPNTVKARLRRASIKPVGYAGPTAIYSPDVIEKVRDTAGPGRPKKEPD